MIENLVDDRIDCKDWYIRCVLLLFFVLWDGFIFFELNFYDDGILLYIFLKDKVELLFIVYKLDFIVF